MEFCTKRARVCYLCHLHHLFILQSPRNNFVCSEMANTPQLQSSWRWPQWRYRSPQDVSAGHGWCHGDKQWKFSNDEIVWGSQIFKRSVKPIGNEKWWRVSYYDVVYKLNFISNSSRISADWSVHSGSYYFHSTGTFAVSTDSPLRRYAGLKFTHRG